MNHCITALVASLMIANATTALAASNTELSVTGMITPNACTPELSDDGKVDHGKLTKRDLHPDRNTLLPRNSLQLAVRCEGATLFALTTLDNREGSAVIPNHHGLGTTANNENLGSVSMALSNPVADLTTPVRTIVSLDGGATWFVGTQLSHLSLLAVASLDNPTQPMAVTNFDADITLNTRIARADSLTLTDEVPLDGHVTVELRYL